MQLPLYFAVFSKDFPQQLSQELPLAAAGYRFAPAGGRILQPQALAADILVLNDSILPPPQEPKPYLEALLQILSERPFRGLMFDFERPVNGFCTAFLSGIDRVLPPQLFWLVPAAYAGVSGSGLVFVSGTRACNSWQRFCEDAQRQFPDRWCLETAPWNELIRAHRRTTCSCEQMRRLRQTSPCRSGGTPPPAAW